jgi:hypothetical protein
MGEVRYQQLNDEHKRMILEDRLQRIEDAHYRGMLDVKDAEDVGDEMALERTNQLLRHLETQHDNAVAELDRLGGASS